MPPERPSGGGRVVCAGAGYTITMDAKAEEWARRALGKVREQRDQTPRKALLARDRRLQSIATQIRTLNGRRAR